MIFSKDGFESFSTTNVVSPSELTTPKSASEWLVTINDSMATLTGSKMGSTVINVRGAPPSTAWSDYGCGTTEFTVDRNDLNDALYLEQHGNEADEICCNWADEEADDSCCNSEEDYIGSLIEAQNHRLLAMEAIISTMQPTINTLQLRVEALERDLGYERSMRYHAEHQLRCVETKVNEAKTNADYTRYAIADSMSRIGALEGTTAEISSRVVVLEQMDSLAMPSKSFDDSADKRNQYVSWKLESGKSSIRGVQPTTVHQDEISFHNQDASVIPNVDIYTVDPATGTIIVKVGKMARSVTVGAAELSTSTPYAICAHPGDVYQ